MAVAVADVDAGGSVWSWDMAGVLLLWVRFGPTLSTYVIVGSVRSIIGFSSHLDRG